MEFLRVASFLLAELILFFFGMYVGMKSGTQIRVLDFSKMTDEEIKEFEREWEGR